MSASNLPEGYGKLGINLQLANWRTEVNLHTTEEYQKVQRNLRQNSKGISCYFCGFPDGPYLEVHHLDGDHTNYSKDNLKAACTLCHRMQHLGWVGIKTHGRLINLASKPDNKLPTVSLEVFNILQRFYLMTDYLTAEQKTKVDALALKQSIEVMLNAFKRRNYELSYNKVSKAKVDKLAAITALQNMGEEEKAKHLADLQEKEDAAKILSEQQSGIEQTETKNHLADGIHIIDLADALCEEHNNYIAIPREQRISENPAELFLNQQLNGEDGRLSIWFNKNVFEPLDDDDFTLTERMDYYNKLDMFSAESITRILHNNRASNSHD